LTVHNHRTPKFAWWNSLRASGESDEVPHLAGLLYSTNYSTKCQLADVVRRCLRLLVSTSSQLACREGSMLSTWGLFTESGSLKNRTLIKVKLQVKIRVFKFNMVQREWIPCGAVLSCFRMAVSWANLLPSCFSLLLLRLLYIKKDSTHGQFHWTCCLISHSLWLIST